MTGPIVEVRDYTIEPEWIEAYKIWADEHAAAWLRTNLNVIDFWLDDGIDAEVSGSSPQVSGNGQPNVCWIIRWDSKEARDEEFPKIMGSPEWADIWAKHPNPKAYLQMNVRFMRPARTA
tara:strand:- start:142 stop:501 length:360 start_codon:yes stop_codon:yes gene_type:complete